MIPRQISLFEDQRLDLEGAIALSLESLRTYRKQYRHWAAAYSGGKDSTDTASFVAWAIKTGQIEAPESFTILYADTRLELSLLHQTAMKLMAQFEVDGFDTEVVMPPLDKRFMVYILGRGVPPPNNKTLRWCTEQIKVKPMMAALERRAARLGLVDEKLLMITGVRLGESEARDQRIAISCSKDSGECGQGWLQIATDETIADTLAPILHWRLCQVYDWLYFETERHGYDARNIALIYGESDVRTGCTGCPLASRDTALERLLRHPEYNHLRPLLELRQLWRELRRSKWRLRKQKPEYRKDGKISKNIQRMGPLTMEARAYGLKRVLDIQRRAGVDLINAEEEARIREMWVQNIWPNKWTGDEIIADQPLDAMSLTKAGKIAVQPLLSELK